MKKAKSKKTVGQFKVDVAVSTPLSRTSLVARDVKDLSTEEIRFRVSVKESEARRIEDAIKDATEGIALQKQTLADKNAQLKVVLSDIDALQSVVEARR